MTTGMEPAAGLADELASAALSLARSFAAGATMWCVCVPWPWHSRHVAVEFVHPVIVGKRALPAVHVDNPDPVRVLRLLARPGDVLLVLGGAGDTATTDLLQRSEAWGLSRIWVGAGSPPATGFASQVVWNESVDADRAAYSGDLVLSYHLLWELTHVVFEHPGLLAPPVSAAACDPESVCITCSDEGEVAEIRGVNDDGSAEVVLAGRPEIVDITLVDPVGPGDLVLVHAGVAITALADGRAGGRNAGRGSLSGPGRDGRAPGGAGHSLGTWLTFGPKSTWGVLHGPKVAETPGEHGRGRVTAGSEPTGFLYPFIEAEEHNADTLVADLARSARAKIDESWAVRESTLQGCARLLEEAAESIADRFRHGGRLFAFGNGGSATDAEGTVALFVDPPSGVPLPARSLVEDRAVLTALANDVGFDLVYSRQIIAHARAGDVAVGFSTSGDSANVVRALEEASRRDVLTLGLAGYQGGALAACEALDHCLVVRCDSVHRIQEAHDALILRLWSLVQDRLTAVPAS